jgi:hypothetical protein
MRRKRRCSVQIRLLGSVVAVGETGDIDLGGRKQRTLVALLASHRGSPVTADRCIDALWGETRPEGARHSLQTYVSNLRGLIDSGHIGLRSDSPHGRSHRRILEENEMRTTRYQRWLINAKGPLELMGKEIRRPSTQRRPLSWSLTRVRWRSTRATASCHR